MNTEFLRTFTATVTGGIITLVLASAVLSLRLRSPMNRRSFVGILSLLEFYRTR